MILNNTITTQELLNMDMSKLNNKNNKNEKVKTKESKTQQDNKNIVRITASNKIVVSSVDVAKHFSKRHSDVMRSIDKIINDLGGANFCVHLFYPSTYTNKQNNQIYKEYLMNKEGFLLLTLGFTGKRATQLRLDLINQFNEQQARIEELEEDLVDMHKVALCDSEQGIREYEANKRLYALRNIKTVLNKSSYKELEDNVNKILSHHEDLKRKDRYKHHQDMNNTEYKQHIRKYTIEKLEEVSNEKKDMLFHNVSDQIIKDLKGDMISTINRSTGAKLSNYKKEINLLKDNQKEEYNIEDLIELKVHPFSVNDMYTYRKEIKRVTKTDKYIKWIHNFPKEEAFLALRDEFHVEHLVDYNKPLKVIMRVNAKEKMDIDNMSKSFIDVIMNDVLGLDDNMVDSVDIKRNKNVDTYDEGRIYFTIRNV